jgi:NTE family protein
MIKTATHLVLAAAIVHVPVFAQSLNRTDQASSAGHKLRVGLALGGGGSRGSAEVGVLKVLQEEHIPIDIIAGTSIGSVVGGFYAAGVPLEKIGEVFEKNTFAHEYAPMPALRIAAVPTNLLLRAVGYRPYSGLYRGLIFEKFAQKMVGDKKIEELSMPFAAVVTDVVTGKSCRITKGDIGLAMRASNAVPGLKKPVQIGEQLFCDGGVINNVPVDQAREMGADFVIAVNIDEKLKDVPLDNFRKIGSMAKQALRIQLAAFDEPKCKSADVCIHPDTTGLKLLTFDKREAKAGITAGADAARAAIPEIKRKLAELGVLTKSELTK